MRALEGNTLIGGLIWWSGDCRIRQRRNHGAREKGIDRHHTGRPCDNSPRCRSAHALRFLRWFGRPTRENTAHTPAAAKRTYSCPSQAVCFRALSDQCLALLRLIVFQRWRKGGAHLFLRRAHVFVPMARTGRPRSAACRPVETPVLHRLDGCCHFAERWHGEPPIMIGIPALSERISRPVRFLSKPNSPQQRNVFSIEYRRHGYAPSRSALLIDGFIDRAVNQSPNAPASKRQEEAKCISNRTDCAASCARTPDVRTVLNSRMVAANRFIGSHRSSDGPICRRAANRARSTHRVTVHSGARSSRRTRKAVHSNMHTSQISACRTAARHRSA